MRQVQLLIPNNNSIKYYKIKTIKKLIEETTNQRNLLLDELIDQATDPVIFTRRVRMLTQLSQLEIQLLSKIQLLETDDVNDLDWEIIGYDLKHIINRGA